MKWQYTVPEDIARSLRDAIEEDDDYATCDAFITVCTWIQTNVPDLEYEMSDLLEEAEFWDIEDEDFQDEINYCLGELYDICDAYRIWIPV